MLYSLIKPFLFKLDPEVAHHFILHLSELYQSRSYSFPSQLSSRVKNLKAPSPIGLAAGLDKNAQALNALSSLGFGLLEAGTVTLKEQRGNSRPRIWRYPEEMSLRNAMGFPNEGMKVVRHNLLNYSASSLLGINIGKNKDTTPQNSIHELGQLACQLRKSDYFTINVSSPNTPGLRALQEPTYLRELFTHLQSQTQTPLFLKIAPDLEQKKIEELAKLACDLKLEGIIATNTTVIPEKGIGGVSGALLKEKAQMVQQTLLSMNTELNIIGVGGISHFKDILKFWYMGGQWVQIYTALIYQGPSLVHKLNQDILFFLDHSQIKDLDTFFKQSLSERRKVIEDYEKKLL
ncbi:MAG: quinone-dependent dihydroorotate dehydrogenase [Bacteriovoracaceae bacterium]